MIGVNPSLHAQSLGGSRTTLQAIGEADDTRDHGPPTKELLVIRRLFPGSMTVFGAFKVQTQKVVARCPDLKVWIDISCVIAFFWTASKIGTRFLEALESMIAAVYRFRRKMAIFLGSQNREDWDKTLYNRGKSQDGE